MKKESYEKLEMEIMEFDMDQVHMDNMSGIAPDSDPDAGSDEGKWTPYF
ncbi:hypothetical protein [Mediterraneibacter sp.]